MNTLIRFLVPITDNDGAAFTADDWNWLEDRLFEVAGGLSLEGVTQGSWRDPETGTVYRDESRRYATAVPADKVDAVLHIIRLAKLQFRQEAMFVEVTPQAVAFI